MGGLDLQAQYLAIPELIVVYPLVALVLILQILYRGIGLTNAELMRLTSYGGGVGISLSQELEEEEKVNYRKWKIRRNSSLG